MNNRGLIISVFAAVCLAAAITVIVQHRQLAILQAQKDQLATQAAERGGSATPVLEDAQATSYSQPSPELLGLRSRITQLTQRKNELAGVREQNEQLRDQLAARGTNSFVALPPGYIRRTQAQWVGMSTPQATIQSFLWAVQNRDLTNVLRVLDANSSRQLLWRMTNSPDFMKDLESLPGMRIVNLRQQNDSSAWAEVEFAPGGTAKEPIYFQLQNGEWKMGLP